MDVSCVRTGTKATVSIVGEIDGLTAPALVAVFDQLLGDGVVDLDIATQHIEFVSSAGLSALIRAHGQADNFKVLRGNRAVDRLITLTGLEILYGDPLLDEQATGTDG